MGGITTAIYGGGPFYVDGNLVIEDLKGSGFTTVIAWCLHINASGDLIYNDSTIVSSGKYIGDSGWPERLANLKLGGSSVNRLLFSVGSGGVEDFRQIQSLIHSLGTGPDNILYKNFKALKDAIPTIDGIDLDDEDLYDQTTIVEFSRILNKLGYEVTFCPFNQMDFWVDCLYALNSKTPSLVTGFNLQCYSGGAGNDPKTWIRAIAEKMGSSFDANGFVYPGLWCRHGNGCGEDDCPDDITNKFATWKSVGIQGGFIWLYDDIQNCKNSGACPGSMDTKAYASAVVKGLSVSSPPPLK